MMRLTCLNCGRPYPEEGAPFRCPKCGGIFDDLDPVLWEQPDPGQSGIWRHFPSAFPGALQVSLGEGNTPLVEARVGQRRVHFKREDANPTGSFKDRGTAALITFLRSRGVDDLVEDSSGNAGASFAAYAARAGLRARVFVPEAASGPKRRQIEAYGAVLTTVPGPRSAATLAAESAAAAGAVYASHAYLPANLAGYATAAFELVHDLGAAPGAVLAPAGQGGVILGMSRGFLALQRAGKIAKPPILIGVQASVCAPIAAYAEIGVNGLELVTEGTTVAEGVRVRSPLRLQSVVEAVRASGGGFVAVREDDILPGRDSLAALGFYVEPTSALVWKALELQLQHLPDPVAVMLTGSGHKWAPT